MFRVSLWTAAGWLRLLGRPEQEWMAELSQEEAPPGMRAQPFHAWRLTRTGTFTPTWLSRPPGGGLATSIRMGLKKIFTGLPGGRYAGYAGECHRAPQYAGPALR